jgi:hypothetical protein
MPFGVVAVVRETLRRDSTGQWSEVGSSLHVWLVPSAGKVETEGSSKGEFLRNLFRATTRKGGETGHPLVSGVRNAESEAIGEIWKPSQEDLRVAIRHAVHPLLAAIVTD